MSQPTKEQWDAVIEKLDTLDLIPVCLYCDGYYIAARLDRLDKRKLGIMVAIDGMVFKREWLLSDGQMSDQARRFWRPRKRQRVSRKTLNILENIHGKRYCKKQGYYDPIVYPWPFWNSPRAFVRHLITHNQDIQILDHDQYGEGLAAKQEMEAHDPS